MPNFCRRLLSASLMIFLAANFLRAEEPSSKDKTDSNTAKADEDKTHTVSRGPLKIEIELDGVFEAANMAEVVLRPKVWSSLVVKKAARQGAQVKQGDQVIWLKTEKIDERIRELKTQRQLARLTLKQSEAELKSLQQSVPLQMQSAERQKQIAAEELKYFREVGRPLAEQSVKMSLKMARGRLENAREELEQLKKMYKADDLTEETEEIILKRARRAVEFAEFSLKQSETFGQRRLEKEIPRQAKQLARAAKEARINWSEIEATLPITQKKKQLQLEQLRFEQKQAEEELARLQEDRKRMTVTAPAAGIVYYGRCVRGQWSGAATARQRLQRGGTLSPNQVDMTIVQPRPLFVRANVPEKQLRHARPEVDGRVIPTAFPKTTMAASVEHISRIPVSSGTFDCRIQLQDDPSSQNLVPGMKCSVKLVPYQKQNALTVPASAVFTDELDEAKHYVYLLQPNGQAKKQPVTIGHKTDKKVEIREGLSEGQTIRAKKPEDSSS